MKAPLLAAAVGALLAASPAWGAGGITGLGALNGTSAVTSISLPTINDAPVNALIIVGLGWSGSTSMQGCSDTAGNRYTFSGGAGSYVPFVCYAVVAADLPAPCTVTASETATLLDVTDVGTCAANATFASGMAISGMSGFTGNFSSGCTLVSGAANCAITGGTTVSSGAATISSVITASWTTAKVVTIVAAVATGTATASPFDIQGTAVTGTGTSLSVTTIPVGAASELAIGLVATSAVTTSHTAGLPFSSVENAPGVVSLAMDKDAFSGATPGTTTVTYSPSWTPSRGFGGNVFTFKAAGGAICTLLTLGVGTC